MALTVLTGTSDGKTVEQALDNGGQMLGGLLISVSLTAKEVVSMSTQIVRDSDKKRYVYTATLLIDK